MNLQIIAIIPHLVNKMLKQFGSIRLYNFLLEWAAEVGILFHDLQTCNSYIIPVWTEKTDTVKKKKKENV